MVEGNGLLLRERSRSGHWAKVVYLIRGQPPRMFLAVVQQGCRDTGKGIIGKRWREEQYSRMGPSHVQKGPRERCKTAIVPGHKASPLSRRQPQLVFVGLAVSPALVRA